eukprot:357833-Chlamydomonas_euryale.AAC.12
MSMADRHPKRHQAHRVRGRRESVALPESAVAQLLGTGTDLRLPSCTACRVLHLLHPGAAPAMRRAGSYRRLRHLRTVLSCRAA